MLGLLMMPHQTSVFANASMMYINQWLCAPEELYGSVVIVSLFNYIMSMKALVQCLPVHLLFIIIITAAILL